MKRSKKILGFVMESNENENGSERESEKQESRGNFQFLQNRLRIIIF